MSLSVLFIWIILGGIPIYAIMRWRGKKELNIKKIRKGNNMDYSTNIGAITVALIILIVALPENGFLMDYRLDYCNDLDKIESYEGFENSIYDNTDPVYINHKGFYVCEIGFINAKVDINIDLLTKSPCTLYRSEVKTMIEFCNLDFMILNKDNYQNFIDGEKYGFSSTSLIALSNYWDGLGNTNAYATDVPLIYDTYYFIVNWEYRIFNDEALVGSRDYGSAYTSFNINSESFDFYYALDIDYTEDNRYGNL